MKIVNIIALILNIIGGINWGLVGLFRFDLVAWICGGQDSVYNRTAPGEEGVVDRFMSGRGKGKNFIGTHTIQEKKLM